MKTKFTYSIITALALVGATTFIGCSSSGGSTDSTATTTLTGTFVDSAVDGLTYKGNLSGTTDAAGHYSFKGTERVDFLLGDKLKLGSLVPKTSQVTVLDFYDGQLTVSDTKVQKLIVLLQSLDSDGDTSNGITILPSTIAKLEALLAAAPYNVTDLTTFDFTSLTMSELTALLNALIAVTDPIVIVNPETNTTTTVEDVVVDETNATEHFTETIYGTQPPITPILGTKLACSGIDGTSSIDAADFNASLPITKRNVSSKGDDGLQLRGNSHNAISPLSMVIPAREANGSLIGGSVHPIVISYLEEKVGTEYEMGDGSADIGDPDQRDELYLAISLDNGDTWTKQQVSNSTAKSSTQVTWAGELINYGGHAQKPEMVVYGNKILLAWHDKYCPSGNPFDLNSTTVDGNTTYATDIFSVNGTQGSIDYTADDGTVMIAPNGKEVYEVPFSCVWTARGFVDAEGNVTWHAPMQLTTGKRDANHVWAAGSEAGFAMAWQEDTKGLRSGKGAGPGDGWSGATTNHGTDIWYTSIKMADFDDDNGTTDDTAKLHSKNNFHYPVRITDNEQCSTDDTKAYCKVMCDTYGFETSTTNNGQEAEIGRCKTYDVDMLDNTQVVLNGDTGASRSALTILKTDMNESVVILSYEETKGLSDNTTGSGDQDQGETETLIEFEGKSVYFESFPFNAIDALDENNISTILTTPMPLVSASNIVNVKVPQELNTSNMIYENARRVVIGNQIDACNADKFTFALLYKQSFDTQGASSDMFVRVNEGFTYASFVPLSHNGAAGLVVTNISAQAAYDQEANASTYLVNWSPVNLDDNTWENSYENTFSPRIFLRGNNIYTGFAYTPNDDKTSQENMPSNFHIHRYIDGVWQGPQNITGVTKASGTTVDARLFSTPRGSVSGLASDASNPNVLFLTWGEIDWIDDTNHDLNKSETNLYYKRSIDGGVTWDAEAQQLATKDGGYIEEKEVNSFASPDGKTIYNVWLQEEEDYNETDPFSGLDTWFGRVDFNVSNVVSN